MWILGGGFAGTWGLCLFFMNRTDNAMAEFRQDSKDIKREIQEEIRAIKLEISELHKCVRDHHGRICELETELEIDKKCQRQ